MKLSDSELNTLNARAGALMDKLHELTGGAMLLLIEQAHEGGNSTIRMLRRGSPYAAVRMAQIYAQGDDNENLASEIGRRIGGDDEAETWKT